MKKQKLFSALLASCMLAGTCISPTAASAEDSYVSPPVQLVYGDVNMDLSVDVADAVAIARYVVSDPELELSDQGRIQGDVNLDQNLDDKDLQKVLLYIARRITMLGVPDQNAEHKYNAVNLMDSIQTKQATGKQADEDFLASQMKLAADLFKGAAQDPESADKDLLISPLSVSQAIAMAANGAKGQTQEEMEKLLGDTLDIDALNQYYYDYTSKLSSTDEAKLHLANSLWIRNDESAIQVPEEFLQTTNDFYGADAYKAPFDDSTVEDVNAWVNENTFEMIPKIVNKMEPDWVMLLINALAFDAEWSMPYSEYNVSDGTFHAYDGDMKVEMMYSKEYTYLEDEYATGFIKQYEGDYSFAAILPKAEKSVTVSDYIGMMTGESLQKLLTNKTGTKVRAYLPKFKYDYSLTMNDMLKALGMKTAFTDNADFTGLNALGSTRIDTVLHKTFIQVDEKGTKAGAVTMIAAETASVEPDPKTVRLDRPFIYMILDNKTNLPLFMGYVLHPTEAE